MTTTTLAEYKVANPATLHLVVSEWWMPVRGFSSIEEAVTSARAGEPYLGGWMVVDVNDSRIRWSWNRQPLTTTTRWGHKGLIASPKEGSPMKFQIGDKVTTEYGPGVVEESSRRRVFIRLDDGDTINVAVGTYGYDRIEAMA